MPNRAMEKTGGKGEHMSKLTVVARLLAQEEASDIVRHELVKLVEPTRKEAGCIEYRLHQDNDNPAVFIFYENWENAACLEKHKETDHYRKCFSAIGGMIVDKAVNMLKMVEP
jgi:quinol monooxygenase YgiN